MNELQIKLLSSGATVPSRGSSGAVGYDLYADMGCVIYTGMREVVTTGIAIALPDGCYGRVAPRSGLASKYGLDVLAGVIDPDYRGEVGVILLNTGDRTVTISAGERIAQLVIEKVSTPNIMVVSTLDDTTRGDGGYGSTGV